MESNGIVLPKEYENIMQKQLGERYKIYKKSLEEPAVRGLRINTNRISGDEFLKLTGYSLEKLPFSKDGYIFNSSEKIGNTPVHLSGLCYLQEPSSMISVCASNIDKEYDKALKVLDLCASPGGKTSQIASRLGENSVVYSNEVVGSRVNALYSNIERQGFENVIVLNEKPENLKCFENYFDYVFVDAPCSGEGMFRKNPETVKEWSMSNVILCAKRQRQILEDTIGLIKNGGKLIYSTCTFSSEEDEDIVSWLLSKNCFELVDVSDEIKSQTLASTLNSPDREFVRKFYPFSGKGEGQFVAVLKKIKEDTGAIHPKKYTKSISKLGRTEKKVLDDWFAQNFKPEFARKISNSNLILVGENVYNPPLGLSSEELSLLDDLKFESIGVKLGSLQKGRFEPNHAIFMAYDKYFNHKVEISEKDVVKYLHGEQLESVIYVKAYAVVTFNKFPLGGAKLAGGKLKNLLPKGLRI